MTYLQAQKKLQTQWKLQTKYLSRAAKKPGLFASRLFPFCLPIEYAEENLFVGIRDVAIEYFDLNDISWHGAALPGKPGNHLCSSQIFAINMLYPFSTDADAAKLLFSSVYPDIDVILPIEEPGRYISFEWIPPENYLNETPRRGDGLRRGLGNTSTDFAFLYRSPSGATRFILGEFKYTESYGSSGQTLRSDGTDRMAPYREFFYAPDSPINAEIAPPIEAFAAEPFYQLLRYQLMARQVEVRKADVIDSASVLYVYVPENRGLQRVIVPEFRELGTEVFDVWMKVIGNCEGFTPITVESLFGHVLANPPTEFQAWATFAKDRYRNSLPKAERPRSSYTH